MGHSSEPIIKSPEVLIIRKIHEGGLLERWNKKYPQGEVLPHDRIYSVNGETNVEAMQREIRSRKIVMRCVRYPDRFQVTVKKDGRMMGFRFEKPQSGKYQEIRISEVLREGLVAEHNELQAERGRWHLVILPEMRIEAANNVDGDAAKIAEELKAAETITLHIRRAEQAIFSQQQVRARLQVLQAIRGQTRSISRHGTPSHSPSPEGSRLEQPSQGSNGEAILSPNSKRLRFQ